MDVCETKNGYEVDVALPGVRPEDIELTVDQNTLTIRGRYSHQNEHQNQPEGQTQEQQQAQGEPSQQQSQAQQSKKERHRLGHNWLAKEIIAGSFERSITFPKPIDTNNIQTKFENGILTILLPISEASRAKRINITGSESQQQQQVPVGAGQKQG